MAKKIGKDAQEEADRKTRRRIARERELTQPKVRAATFKSGAEHRRKPKYGNWADQEERAEGWADSLASIRMERDH